MSESEPFLQPRFLNEPDQGWHKKRIKNLGPFAYLSYSRVKTLMTSMYAFKRRYILGHKSEDTPARILGRIIHKALLEPEDFLKKYKVQPDFSGKGKKARTAEWFEGLAIDAIVLTQKQADSVLFMIDSVRNHSEASEILKGCNFETHGYYKDPRLDQWFYGIIDFMKSSIVGDLKSCASAHPENFGKDIFNYEYFIQSAIYLDIFNGLQQTKLEHFPIIAVENCEPFTTMVYRMPDHMIEIGRNLRDAKVREYKIQIGKHFENPEETIWPGYFGLTGISEPIIPTWALAKLEALQEAHCG